MGKKVYIFGGSGTEGDASMADVLGGKGANLAEMARLGMPVPLGITIPTTVCNEYHAASSKMEYIESLVDDYVMPALYDIVNEVGYAPLWSVRSGAKFSMPGMMDTLLNVGITDDSRWFWHDRLGECAAYDCERRLIAMFGETVYGLNPQPFKDDWNNKQKQKFGMKNPPGSAEAVLASPKHMAKCVEAHRKIFAKRTGFEFPYDLRDQMKLAIEAVFQSWKGERAIEYREMHGIPHDLGTAVNIQMMVFGNMNDQSGSGVAFTRDPATGDNKLMGEFLMNAQGEDVVAGTTTPKPLNEMPANWLGQLNVHANLLEDHYRDMMDIEFTVENDILWMLQCRVGKRSAEAAFRIAHDMVEDGLIDKPTAVSRVTAKQYLALKKVRIEGDVPEPDFVGIAAGGGLVVGQVETQSEDAKKFGAEKPIILVTDETTPDDFGGMAASVGILTRTGGATSHAAVVGRSLDKSCVVGCTDLPDIAAATATITIDGATGRVWLKELPLTTGEAPDFAKTVFKWAVDLKSGDIVVRSSYDKALSSGDYACLYDATENQVTEFLINSFGKVETRAFIDITFPAENRLDDDKQLWNLAGDVGPDFKEMTENRVNSILGVKVIENTVIVPNNHLSASQTEALRSAGWKVVSRVKSVEELLDSDGIVDIDPSFSASIGGEHVAEKLFKLMSDAGKSVENRPEPVSHEKLIHKVLK